MKKTLIILAAGLLSLNASAQLQTTITGKVLSHEGNKAQISIEIRNFNPGTMAEEKTRLQTSISSDGTYQFTTGEIKRSYTRCFLTIQSQVLEVLVSPGDSLHIEADYWAVATTAGFSGSNAGVNSYWNQHLMRVVRPARLSKILYRPEKFFVDNLRDFTNDQVSLLDQFIQQGRIDSTFYRFERKRIEYDYYASLLSTGPRRPSTGDESLDEINRLAGRFNFNDEDALIDISAYRSFIVRYFTSRAKSASAGREIDLPVLLDLADENLAGLVHTWLCWSAVKDAAKGTGIREQKAIYNFFRERYTGDSSLMRLLDQSEVGQPYSDSITFKVLKDILITGILVFLVLLLIVLYRSRLNKRNQRFNWAGFVLAALSIGLVFVALDYIFSQTDRSWPLLRVAFMLAFFAVQLFWLIPAYASKKRYLSYMLWSLAFYLIHGYLQFRSGRWEYNAGSASIYDQTEWIRFFLISGLAIMIIAFLFYYLGSLARKNRPLGDLFAEGMLNPELAVNTLLVFMIFTFSFPAGHRFMPTVIVLMAFSVLYIHTFYLIPAFLFRKRYVAYLGYSAGLLAVIALVLMIYDGSGSFLSLRGKGIPVTIWSQMAFPKNLGLYLAIIPALIYAYSRRYLQTRVNQGFALYRRKEAELQQLRSQVNPHFLFNSLNTVYAFALKENNPRTAEYIAKLASLMRYLIDDMEKDRIPLQKEIDYIRDYINLQKIRSSVEHVIDFQIDVDNPDFQVAPMMMIPFVENAFKHGMNPNKTSEMRILIQVRNQEFRFEIENSVDKNLGSFYKEMGFGIGIANLRQRLELIYPGSHSLFIREKDNQFTVALSIRQ